MSLRNVMVLLGLKVIRASEEGGQGDLSVSLRLHFDDAKNVFT